MHTDPKTPVAVQAALDLDFDKLKSLSDHEIKIKDNLGRAAIHAAAYKGNEEILAYLLHERHLDKDLKDNNGATPLVYACGFQWMGN